MDIDKILCGKPQGLGRGLTNLTYHLPRYGDKIKYWWLPDDLRRHVLDNITMGEKYIFEDNLKAVLNKFSILREDDEEDAYITTMGEFLSPSEFYHNGMGYTLNHGDPLKKNMRVNGDGVVHGTIFCVRFKHKYLPHKSHHAYYSLLNSRGVTAAVCFGQV